MKNAVRDVMDWMDAFGVKYPERPDKSVSTKDRLLCESLVREESNELVKAMQANDLTEVADGIIDTIWVCLYAANKYGMWFLLDQLWDEVKRSNFSKLDDNGKPLIRRDGKILKSNNFSQPDLKSIIDLVPSEFYQLQEQMYAHDIRTKEGYEIVPKFEYNLMNGEERRECVIIKR